MKIYFSVDTVQEDEPIEGLKKLMGFLHEEGHTLYRAPYILSKNPDLYLQKELGLKRKPTSKEERALHMRWIDDSDLLLADVSAPSEGRSIIIQRALDKPAMGLPYTPVMLIRDKKVERRFGKIMSGIIHSNETVYYEYANIKDVIGDWPTLLNKALKKRA